MLDANCKGLKVVAGFMAAFTNTSWKMNWRDGDKQKSCNIR